MIHRIRGAALVVKNQRLLLVRHQEARTGADYWVPPGGGMEVDDASIFACAVREALEETGVRVRLNSILYIQEFVDHAYDFRNMEFFILAETIGGDALVAEISPSPTDHPVIAEVGWFSQDAMQAMIVFPECLKDTFWDDRNRSPITTIHLGTRTREKTTKRAV